jgi:hypothetical protein
LRLLVVAGGRRTNYEVYDGAMTGGHDGGFYVLAGGRFRSATSSIFLVVIVVVVGRRHSALCGG